jgi:uncharacterized protein
MNLIVYEATKNEFISHVHDGIIVDRITDRYMEKIGRTNDSEVRSWENSMFHMYRVLNDNDIPGNAGVAVEFQIPRTSNRVDFLLSGHDGEEDTVVIIELKQWDKVEKVDSKEAIVKTRFRHGNVETTHPSYQAWSYAMLIEDYNENVQEQHIQLSPCAYLHNYKIKGQDDPLIDDQYSYYIEKAPIYSKSDIVKLRNFIKKHIKFGDEKQLLYQIENGRLRPSKSLQDVLSNMLKGNQEFVLIDNQKVVYETALQLAIQAAETDEKHVMIIKGGPGTGKSVLAINLLVELTKRELVSTYVTRAATPREIYSAKLKGTLTKGRIDNLFKGSGSFTSTEENEFDALIVDEAHRLNEKSGMFNHLGENQIKEIMFSSRFSIFFIDENQRVTLKDFGSKAEILKQAKELGVRVTYGTLESQFRCDGSDGYIAWLDDLLGIRDTANVFDMSQSYDFRVFTDPNELRNAILKANKQANKSRIVAGYCWDWPKNNRNETGYHDILIPDFDFGMSWNLGNTATWAIDEKSVEEVGCIHTSQGLEFDYVGVIIGDDLRYEAGEVITDFTRRAKTDRSLFGIKKRIREDPETYTKIADQIIRNTYRTLMTRGQKGCYIYCTDKELSNYIESRLQRTRHSYELESGESLVAERKDEY